MVGQKVLRPSLRIYRSTRLLISLLGSHIAWFPFLVPPSFRFLLSGDVYG